MKTFGIFLLFIGIMLGCAPVKTKTHFDDKFDFSSYKTFCWLSGCEFVYEGPQRYNDSLAIDKIRHAVIQELLSKGLTQDENNPDILIDFHIIIEEKTNIITHRAQYEDERGYAWYPPSYEVYNYLKGSLIIDMIDNSQSRMVWRSHSVGYLEAFPVITDQQIERSVREALKDFPPVFIN